MPPGEERSQREYAFRRQRIVAYSLLWVMVAGFAWVVIESAQALSIF